MELQYIYEGMEKGKKNNVGIKLLSQKSMNYVEWTINYKFIYSRKGCEKGWR